MANALDIQLGRSVIDQREECDLSCEQLAQEIGVSVATMSAYEGGQLRIPVATLVAISDVLNVPLAGFFQWGEALLLGDQATVDLFHPLDADELTRLRSAFSQITCRGMRDAIIQLIEHLAKREAGDPPSRCH